MQALEKKGGGSARGGFPPDPNQPMSALLTADQPSVASPQPPARAWDDTVLCMAVRPVSSPLF